MINLIDYLRLKSPMFGIENLSEYIFYARHKDKTYILIASMWIGFINED